MCKCMFLCRSVSHSCYCVSDWIQNPIYLYLQTWLEISIPMSSPLSLNSILWVPRLRPQNPIGLFSWPSRPLLVLPPLLQLLLVKPHPPAALDLVGSYQPLVLHGWWIQCCSIKLSIWFWHNIFCPVTLFHNMHKRLPTHSSRRIGVEIDKGKKASDRYQSPPNVAMVMTGCHALLEFTGSKEEIPHSLITSGDYHVTSL